MALIQCSAIDSSRDSMLRSKRWLRRAAGGACELARAEGFQGHSALRGFFGSEIVLRARKKASGHHLPVHPFTSGADQRWTLTSRDYPSFPERPIHVAAKDRRIPGGVMPPLRRLVWWVPAVLALLAPGAGAAARVPELGNGDLTPPGLRPVEIDSPALQQSLSRGPAWRGFSTEHRGWHALWNQATGTPHRAFGPGIPLPGFAPRPAAADRAVRAFIAGHPELFGTGPTLETLAAHPVQDRWYVRYRQTVGGVPVLFADW